MPMNNAPTLNKHTISNKRDTTSQEMDKYSMRPTHQLPAIPMTPLVPHKTQHQPNLMESDTLVLPSVWLQICPGADEIFT